MDRDREDAGLDDAVIIERSRRKPEQFAVLFGRHAPRIHRYVARRVGRQMADDLVAETFLAAFAKRDAYRAAYRDAAPWLYGIATNLIGQHRRDEVRPSSAAAAAPTPVPAKVKVRPGATPPRRAERGRVAARPGAPGPAPRASALDSRR